MSEWPMLRQRCFLFEYSCNWVDTGLKSIACTLLHLDLIMLMNWGFTEEIVQNLRGWNSSQS